MTSSCKPTSRNHFLLTISLSVLLLLAFVSSDVHAQCGAPDQLPTVNCEDAPIICLQDWCYETTQESSPEPWTGFCGFNTSVQNPQFYKIIADSGFIEIEINVSSCSGGQNTLQAALIGACPWEVSDVWDCHNAAPPGSDFVLTAGGDAGQMFWLLIDGSAGSTCEYTITSIYGAYNPEFSEELTMILASDTTLVAGLDVITLEVSPRINFAHGYYWVPGWGPENDTLYTTEPTIDIYVPCDVAPGLYTICARAFSGCDISDTAICVEVEVIDEILEVDIIQVMDTLCTSLPEMAIYKWYDCVSLNTLSTSPCFIPPSTGCYCVEVTTQAGCTVSNCYDFINSSVNAISDKDILISPIPSKGTFDISLSSKFELSAKWTLVDTWGRVIENGNLAQQVSRIELEPIPTSGLYYLKITSPTYQTITTKLLIQAQ
jgi:hypothetical protein